MVQVILTLAVCVWLAGCACQLAEDIRPKTEDRAVKTKPAKVRIPDPDHFTTKGKPTMTVWTPWGERQIYDPTQDPQVIADLARYKANGFGLPKSSPDENPRNVVERFQHAYPALYHSGIIHQRDYARLGCFKIRNAFCGLNDEFLAEDCGDETTFGQEEWSDCENRKLVFVAQGAGPPNMCSFGGNPRYVSGFNNQTTAYYLKHRRSSIPITRLQCELWRGEQPKGNYWLWGLPAGPGVKLLFEQTKE